VAGLPSGAIELLTLDPRDHFPDSPAPLKRPAFLAIVSAHSLATTLARKANGRVDGFIVEGPTAGGHNAPPRGDASFDALGEPIYGLRDIVDLDKVKELGVPFWIAGGSGSPQGLRSALAAGAAGIQVGTMFAYSDESGLTHAIKTKVLAGAREGTVHVRTDPRASPTGYPFKVVEVDGLRSQTERRQRVCDLGYLRTPYANATGGIGYRCPAEPVDAFVAKGGDVADTVGRRCLCNGLAATIGHAQSRNGDDELPLVTSGDDLTRLGDFLQGRDHYGANDVLDYLLGDWTDPPL
jgi:nitronate monooxygenase